jgi:hypothetical protein
LESSWTPGHISKMHKHGSDPKQRTKTSKNCTMG